MVSRASGSRQRGSTIGINMIGAAGKLGFYRDFSIRFLCPRNTTPTMAIPLPPRIDATFGLDFVGVLVAAALWGISAMQTYEYFTSYHSSDLWKMQTMVYTVFILDTLHQISVSHAIYVYLVADFAAPAKLQEIVWSFRLQVIFCALISSIVQCFFAWRVWKLSHHNILAISFIVGLIMTELCLGIVYFVKTWALGVLANLPRLTSLGHLVNIFAVAGDLAITISLVYLLHSSKPGIPKTNSLLNRLILFSLKTGLLTSLCSICSLVMLAALPGTFGFIAFYTVLARCNSISLFATLNSRKLPALEAVAAPIEITSVHWRNTDFSQTQGSRPSSPASAQPNFTKAAP
ncbi:hypothetical protein C8R46DRAFT_1363287 [Mycena filopes]|nr:hypothetical protein C8R46DRAFT_1363287 [Mycena filopes]